MNFAVILVLMRRGVKARGLAIYRQSEFAMRELHNRRGKCEALSSVVGLAMEADLYNTASASIILISFLSIDASQSKQIKIFKFPK